MKTYLPTRKWWVATITGAATVAGMLLTGDHAINTDPEWIAVIGIAAARAIAFVTKNEDTPGGVPVKPTA